MVTAQLAEYFVNFAHRQFMHGGVAQLVKDGVQQEHPELSVSLCIRPLHIDDDSLQRHRDGCRIIVRYDPWRTGGLYAFKFSVRKKF